MISSYDENSRNEQLPLKMKAQLGDILKKMSKEVIVLARDIFFFFQTSCVTHIYNMQCDFSFIL